MKLTEKFLTQNDCFKQARAMTPRGIMVHSTATPGVMNEAWFSRWNKPGIEKCVHAFVDDTGVMQTLPWKMAGWHSGVGTLGKSKNANNTGYIGFEICEPGGFSYQGNAMTGYNVPQNQAYFDTVYALTVDLCAYLCEKYDIPPEKPYLICHSEGYSLGIASNHGDVMHWFPKHGKDMDMLRADVKAKLKGVNQSLRSFRLKEEMNLRETPNGTVLGAVPANTVIAGSEFLTANGIQWLRTVYNKTEGYVAVLPLSRNYAEEVFDTDYEVLFREAEKKLDLIRAILE